MPVRHGRGTILAVLLFALAGYAGAARSAQDSGERPLRDVLRELQDAGLPLVFSNALIAPRDRTSAAIDPAGDLAGQAATLLAPFGLGLERTRSGVWYVVRRAAPASDRAPVPATGAPAPAPLVEEMVVSSTRYRLERDVHERRSLERRELNVMPSIGRDLLRSVNQLPGQASMGISARSHMRGGDTNEVLYLLDGVPILEPFHQGDFHALFSAINPALVDAIDVYHAGFPAAYGSRLSGVVDMTLVEPERPRQGRVNVDFINAAAQTQGYAGRLQWLVSARRSTVDQLLGSLEQDYGEPSFHDELVRLAWNGDTTDLVAGLLYGNDELSLTYDSIGEAARADDHNLAAWLRVGHDLGDDARVQLAATYTTVDDTRRGRLDDPVDAVGSLAESRQFDVVMLRGTLRWQPADGWLVHTGLEAQRQEADFDVAIESDYGPLGEPLQPADRLTRDVSAGRDGSLVTAFLSVRRELGAAVTAELGGRYDMQDIDPVHDNQFSPRLHLVYAPDGRWSAFADLGRYAQHQNLYELQLDDGLLELSEPQLADQLSVGAAWSPNERWRIRAEAYWRDIDDPWPRFENLYNRWVLLPELHADRVRLEPRQARTRGGELGVDFTPDDTWQWSLTVATARAEEHLDGHWRPRPWEQRHTVRGALAWEPGRWRLGVTATYHDGWPTTSLVAGTPTGPQRLYGDTLPDYFSLDVHAARYFELPHSTLEIYFDLSNATLADNVGGYHYHQAGDRLVRERRDLLPGVPVLGLSWTW